MTTTPRLPFDYRSPYPDGIPGHHGKPTEVAAAFLALETATKNMRRAYAYIDGRGEYGATDIEGQAECFYSFPKRRCDLYQTQPRLLFDSGRTRPTPRNAQATVWVSRRVWLGETT